MVLKLMPFQQIDYDVSIKKIKYRNIDLYLLLFFYVNKSISFFLRSPQGYSGGFSPSYYYGLFLAASSYFLFSSSVLSLSSSAFFNFSSSAFFNFSSSAFLVASSSAFFLFSSSIFSLSYLSFSSFSSYSFLFLSFYSRIASYLANSSSFIFM